MGDQGSHTVGAMGVRNACRCSAHICGHVLSQVQMILVALLACVLLWSCSSPGYKRFFFFFPAQVNRSISTQQSMLEGSHFRGFLGSKEQSYWDGSCGQHRGSNLGPQAYKAALLQLRPLPALYPQMFDSTALVCVCLRHWPQPCSLLLLSLSSGPLCLPGKVLPPPDAAVLRLLYSCL